jgi:hypothetical protein
MPTFESIEDELDYFKEMVLTSPFFLSIRRRLVPPSIPTKKSTIG